MTTAACKSCGGTVVGICQRATATGEQVGAQIQALKRMEKGERNRRPARSPHQIGFRETVEADP